MISLALIIYVLIVHFAADFCLQTHEQATKKSTGSILDESGEPTFPGMRWLTYHVSTYSFVWFFGAYVMLHSWELAFLFTLITFICHWITDYITSRIGKVFWEKQDFHNGFVVVGADQILHYVQLFLTFMILSPNSL